MTDRRTAPQILLPTFTLPNVLPGVAQWVNPVPSGAFGSAFLRSLWLTCVSSASYSIHLVPPGGTPLASNLVFGAATPMVTGDVWDLFGEEKEKSLPAGYSMFFFASAANSINATLWGEIIS